MAEKKEKKATVKKEKAPKKEKTDGKRQQIKDHAQCVRDFMKTTLNITSAKDMRPVLSTLYTILSDEINKAK